MKKTKDSDELTLFPSENKYQLPNQFKGEVRKNGGLTNNDPRKWTEEEVKWALNLREKGLTINQIAKCLDRDSVGAVSYTHLRAHETKAQIVCRLLLEKKKIFDP